MHVFHIFTLGLNLRNLTLDPPLACVYSKEVDYEITIIITKKVVYYEELYFNEEVDYYEIITG